MNKTIYNFSLFVVCFTILWIPIQKLLIQIDGAGRIPVVLSLVAIFINFQNIGKYCLHKPLSFYLLLSIYIFLNGLAFHSNQLYDSGFAGVFQLFRAVFVTPMIMLVVVVLCQQRFEKTLNVLTIIFLIYTILSFFTMDTSSDRIRSAITNTNELVLMIFPTFPLLLVQYINNRIKLIPLICLELLVFIVVVLSGSRMGFGMALIVLLGAVMMLSRKRKASSIIILVLLLIGIYVAINYVIDSTVVGARLANTTTQMEGETGTFWDKLGDRGIQYYLSWPVFRNHPIFGIGFRQWESLGITYYRLHSEYLVQYVELGFVGITLFLLFFIGLLKKVYQCKKNKDDCYSKIAMVFFVSLLAILFGNAVLWSYNSVGVFVIYGISYSIFYSMNNKVYV